MSLHKGITQKNNGNYSFRFAISKRLQPYFNRVEFKKTYDITKHLNFKEILNNVNNIKFQYEVIKDKIFMRTLSDTEIQDLVNEFIVNNLNEDYECRINGSYSGSFYSGHDTQSNKSPHEQVTNHLELLINEAKEELTNVNSNFMINIASELLETLNINIEELDKKSKLEFLYALKQSNIDFLEEQLNRTKGISKAVKLSKSKKINVISESDTSSKLTIEKATDDYLIYYKDNNTVTTKTMNEKEKALKYFLNVMQHLQLINVAELKKSDIDTFVNKYLKQKPKQTGKLRELTNEELIIAIDNSIYNDINKISTNTINKHYQHISGFCNYLYDDGLIDKKINQAHTEQELENKECFTMKILKI